MGKSGKKFSFETVPTLSAKQGKKGKRKAEVLAEKPVGTKKKKREPEKVVVVAKKDDKSLSESEGEVKVLAKKQIKPAKAAPVKESSSSDESSSDEDITPKTSFSSKNFAVSSANNGASVFSNKKKQETSGSSDPDSSSDEQTKPATSKSTSAKPPQETAVSSESSSEEDSEKEDEGITPKVSAKANGTFTALNTQKPSSESSESEFEESDSDDGSEEIKIKASTGEKKPQPKTAPGPTSKRKIESSDSSDSDSDSDASDAKNIEVENTLPENTTKSGKEPKTPSKQNQVSGSKTLFVGNFPYKTRKDEVVEFFKGTGEIVDVRLVLDSEGNTKGYGYVEFATTEEAQKGLELNGMELSGRAVKLDLALERGAYTPYSEKESKSYQKGGSGQSKTVFIKGFDKSLDEHQIQSSLQNHFGSCGEITRISIPKDYETGASKGIAYMDMKDQNGFVKALKLNESDLGGYTIVVDRANPKVDGGCRGGGKDSGGCRGGGRDSSGRRGGGGDSGGRRGRGKDSGGRRGRGRDSVGHRSGGRDSGGRRGGGRFGARGRGGSDNGRGHGGLTIGTGKKTVFGDD